MKKKAAILALLLLAVVTAGCGGQSGRLAGPKVPPPDTTCVAPTVHLWATPDSVMLGAQVTVHLDVTGAEYATLYRMYSGSVDSVRVTSDTTYTFRPSGLGVYTFMAFAKAKDGECSTTPRDVRVVVTQTPPVCTEPTVHLWTTPSTVAQGSPATVNMTTEQAAYTTIYHTYGGHTDSIRVVADTSFTFMSNDVGTHLFRAVAKARNGDCSTTREVRIEVVKVECVTPAVSVRADKHRILSGEQVAVHVTSTGADIIRLYLSQDGKPDSLITERSEANFTTYLIGSGTHLGINTLKVVGAVRNGDCSAQAVFSLLIVPNCGQWCDSEGNLRQASDSWLWKACYDFQSTEGVITQHVFVLLGRHSTDVSAPEAARIAAGFQKSKAGEPNIFLWLRGPVQNVVVEAGYDKEWVDLGKIDLPEAPGHTYGGVLAHPAFNGLGSSADPTYSGVTTFHDYASWPF